MNPGADLRFRDAMPEELDRTAAVMTESYAEYSRSFPGDAFEAYTVSILDVRSRLPDSELIIAERGDSIVGAVTFYPDGTKTGGADGWPKGWAGLRLLAVHPDSRGLGIGRGLTEECMRRCRERGIPTLGLHSTRPMAVAREMYRKMGFRRVPEFDFHPGEENVVMAFRLDV